MFSAWAVPAIAQLNPSPSQFLSMSPLQEKKTKDENNKQDR